MKQLFYSDFYQDNKLKRRLLRN